MRVGRSCDADTVVSNIERLVSERGAPEHLRMDNGPELVAWALRDCWTRCCLLARAARMPPIWRSTCGGFASRTCIRCRRRSRRSIASATI